MVTHPFIVLNMIVKNESHIIVRLLQSVIHQIDGVVISDTGSTDNTKEVISNFMKSYPNVQLVFLPDIPFKNFGYNRTYSLKGCIQATSPTYILLLDADMVFKQTGNYTLKEFLLKNEDSTTIDLFNIAQGSSQYYYYNSRIIKNTIFENSQYLGVTHEYLGVPSGAISKNVAISDFFIEDIGDGGAKANKFERDIELLTQGLADEPNNERYMFYLANSMRDAGRPQDAIIMYKRRIDVGGWFEEVWYSHYEIGNCYLKLEQPENAIYWWLKALEFNDYRIENLYQIVYYYCRNLRYYKLAHHFYLIAKEVLSARPQRDDILFFDKGMHTFLLDFEYTIFANYYNPLKGDVMAKYMELLSDPILPSSIKYGLYYNMKFESFKLTTIMAQFAQSTLICQIQNIAKSIIEQFFATTDNKFYINSTPTIIYDVNANSQSNNTVYINIRFVNYEIDNEGNYSKQSFIGTINVFYRHKIDDPYNPQNYFILQYDKSYDNINDGYVGLEDLRFFLFHAPIMMVVTYNPFTGNLIQKPMMTTGASSSDSPTLLYNCNRGIGNTGKITVECGLIKIDDSVATTSNESVFELDENVMVEKNWVMFLHKDKCKFIYKWGNNDGRLMIAEKSDDNGTKLTNWQTVQSPPFFRDLRGSSNGVLMPDGNIWFICHLVSYEERRFYYHCFVVLDADTLEIVRYSKFWTFDGASVEYCTSFFYNHDNDSIIIGYSVMDCSTNFLEIPLGQLEMNIFYKSK
jgi:tetratricopeptide (TPR) repeat protein